MTQASPRTVYEAFARTAARVSDRAMLNVMPGTAQVYGIPAGETSYTAAQSRVDDLAYALAQAGCAPGCRIALLLENRPDFFLWWLAANKIGASVVPINPDLRAGELEYLIGHSGPVLIVAIAPRHADLETAAAAAGSMAPLIGSEDKIPNIVSPPPAEPCDPMKTEAALLYTSGTTGHPKGCVLPNEYFLMAGQWYARLDGIAQLHTDGERMITPLPVFHMNAMAYSFMAMITVGGCLTALDRFHPSTWWADVAASGATCLHYLGVMPSMLLARSDSDEDSAHNVRFGFGAGVDPEKQVAFERRFGFPLVEAWAMTETGAGAVIAASGKDRLVAQASIGKPAPSVETRIVDATGAQADTGELLVRHAGDDPKKGFFSEYYKDPDATAKAWAEGWFHTGDIVRKGADGNMFFVDRTKNIIRRSGENIAAVEVESFLMRHPGITAAGVTAVPDALRGDEVFACIVAAEPLDPSELVTWCLGQMAYYKVPGYVAFVDALPLTATQKIQRADLKAFALSRLDDPDTHNMAHLKKRQVA